MHLPSQRPCPTSDHVHLVPDRNATLKVRPGLRFTRDLGATITELEISDPAPAGTHLAEKVLGKLQYKPEIEQYLEVLEGIGSVTSDSAQPTGRRGRNYRLVRVPKPSDFSTRAPPPWVDLEDGSAAPLVAAYRDGLRGNVDAVRTIDPERYDVIHAHSRAAMIGLQLSLDDALTPHATRVMVRAATLPRRRFFARCARWPAERSLALLRRDVARHPAVWRAMERRLASFLPAFAALAWTARGGPYQRIMAAGLVQLEDTAVLPFDRLHLEGEAPKPPACLVCGTTTPPIGDFLWKSRFGITAYACSDACGEMADRQVLGTFEAASV